MDWNDAVQAASQMRSLSSKITEEAQTSEVDPSAEQHSVSIISCEGRIVTLQNDKKLLTFLCYI